MSRFDTMAFDFQLALSRHNGEQRLRRRNHAADGVHGKLLHDPVCRRGEGLQPRPLLGLDQVFGKPRRLALRFHQVARQHPAVLRPGLGASLNERGDSRLSLAIAALLHLALLPLLDQLLERFEIGDSRAQLLFHELLAHSQALLDERDHGVELGDCRRNRRAFGFLLGALAVERSEFGRKLRFLARQELALHRDKIGRCPLGRAKLRDRIGGSTQRGA